MFRFPFAHLLLLTLGLSATACQQNCATVEPEYFPAPGTEGMNLPFSGAVKVGQTVYLSGNLGNVPGEMKLVDGGVAAETRQTMENIKAALAVVGGSLDDIVKCQVFLDDISEWSAFNEVYREYFGENPPARSALGADGLALGAAVEVDCIAVL